MTRLWSTATARVVTVLALVVTLSGAAGITFLMRAKADPATQGCQLSTTAGSNVRHVIYLQCDNVQFNRDNPTFASDLE